jgi:hypothetical protein
MHSYVACRKPVVSLFTNRSKPRLRPSPPGQRLPGGFINSTFCGMPASFSCNMHCVLRSIRKLASPKQPRQPREPRAMPRDKPITPFRQCRNPRNFLIQPQRPPAKPRVAQRPKNRLRPAVNPPVRFDELHRVLHALRRQFRKSLRHERVLRPHVFDAPPGGFLPAEDPKLAEVAIPVVNHQRFRRAQSHLCHCLFHTIIIILSAALCQSICCGLKIGLPPLDSLLPAAAI